MSDHRITAELKTALVATLTAIRRNSNSNVTTLKNAKVRLQTDVALADAGLAELAGAGVIAPSPFPAPQPPPPPVDSALRIGLVPGGEEAHGIDAAARLEMKVMRSHDKGVGDSADSLGQNLRYAASKGIETIILMGDSSPSSPGNAGQWAAAYGPGGSANLRPPVRFIEWGNEDSYDYDPKPGPGGGGAYGASAKKAYAAIHSANPGVGLLCQIDDGGTGSTQWIDGLLSAWPEAKTQVSGWVVHPYGPPSNGKLQRAIKALRDRGIAPVIFCTEDGMATDNGRTLTDNYGWAKNQTYAGAANDMATKVAFIQSTPEVKVYLVYQGYDQRAPGQSSEREHYFGVFRQDGSDKGPYTTTVRDLVATQEL